MARDTNRAMWTSDRRLYLDKNGQAVEADSPDRVSLLVAEGAQIPMDRARALGLAGDGGEPLGVALPAAEGGEPKAPTKRQPANKARQPEEDKAPQEGEDK